MAERISSKEAIKNTARKIITDEGIVRFNMRKLSKISGLAPGTIYYYFPGKAELIFEIVDDLWHECFYALKTSGYSCLNEAIEKIYKHILGYFLKFTNDWIHELATLNPLDKKSGRKFEDEYLSKLKEILKEVLNEYAEEISAEAKEKLGTCGIVDFVYINFMFFIRKGDGNVEKLLFILNKILI